MEASASSWTLVVVSLLLVFPWSMAQTSLSSPCDKHLDHYLGNLSTAVPWALQMFDATTKIPSGWLYSSPIDFGNYDECVSIKKVVSEDGAFGGKYCLVSVATSTPTGDVRDFSIHQLKDYLARRRVALTGPLPVSFSGFVGACLPSSCSADDFGLFLTQWGQQFLPGAFFSTIEDYCDQGLDEPLDPLDWFTVGFLIFFVVLAAASTTYDLLTTDNSKPRNELWVSFSVYTNGRRLLSTKTSGRQELTCLHGIRFLSMVWVTLCHRYSLNATFPSTNNMVFTKEVIEGWRYMFLHSGTLSVDSFFFLSGLLLSYVFLNGVARGNKFNLLVFYLHRYIRLTPALIVVILMYVTLVPHLGTGPMWKASSPLTGLGYCESNWWQTILYVNNYLNLDSQCVGQAWYLSADMQLYLLSPLVLLPLWKKPRLGKALLVVLFLVGVATTFAVCFVYEIRTFVKAATLVDVGDMRYFHNYYYFTHTRFTPWLVGVALGYILHKVNKGSMTRSSMIHALGIWTAAAFLMLLSLCVVFPMNQPDHDYDQVESSFYNSLHRPAWALGLAFMVYACCTGRGGPVDAFLSWSFFVPLSRLTYGIYLIHPMLQCVITYPKRNIIYNSDMLSLSQTMSDVVFSSLLAIVLSLLFEAPFTVLERFLLGTGTKRKRPEAGNHQDQEEEDTKRD